MTGGLSLFAGGEAISLFNVGGGVERWMTPHAGVRIEVREQFGGASLLGVRVGVVFRQKRKSRALCARPRRTFKSLSPNP
jgi:hypothetical protein